MKTKRIHSMARLTGITVALALFAAIGGNVQAQEKGATRILKLSESYSEPQAEPNAYKPMSCAKCKDELVTRKNRTARGASKPEILLARHLCGGCENQWKVIGHGKAKKSVASHKCKACGAEQIACCSTSKSTEIATKGMEN